MLGYAVWHYAVWEVYYSKSSPRAVPFAHFDEVTRALAISIGGMLGLAGKEIISFVIFKPRATKATSHHSK